MTQTARDETRHPDATTGVIYLAGGRFWDLQHLLDAIDGVTETSCGYANSTVDNPSHEQVESGATRARETVRVVYDPTRVSLEALLYAFFSVIDPTTASRQGDDVGSRYQTGIYYTDEHSGEVARRIAETEKSRYGILKTEVKPLENFYEAADEHQKHFDRHPGASCRFSDYSIKRVGALRVDPSAYRRDDEPTIWRSLTPTSYDVTQRQGTEPAGSNDLWNTFPDGLYVDVVTGEPLFSSDDKFESTCGWPSFTRPVDENVIRRRIDTYGGMTRMEVSSRVGNSHLGHVFDDDPESPNGIRYCINGAALRLIPYDRLEQEGYGAYADLVHPRQHEEEPEPPASRRRLGFFRRKSD
ncbi:MAG: peptide-methionine (R)-S-oxide reductase MsrB [Coriobacteriales bacterium]